MPVSDQIAALVEIPLGTVLLLALGVLAVTVAHLAALAAGLRRELETLLAHPSSRSPANDDFRSVL